MSLHNLEEVLRGNSYPGRGILIGKSTDGGKAVIAYFIMGRSANSRNRVFTETADGIRTEAFDEAKLEDPSLIIYAPVRTLGHHTIVTNGDQTDTVYQFLERGDSFVNALRTRTFEPDSPNFTPRISGLLTADNGDCSYTLSILKSFDGNPDAVQRFFYEYTPVSGIAHLLHTYHGDGHPRIPSFEGVPTAVALGDQPIGDFTNALWDTLNEENRVSLFVRYLDLHTGKAETEIINKNRRDA